MKNLLFTFAAFILFTSLLFSQPDTLTILHVNDTHSCLSSLGPRGSDLEGTNGGIARVATVIGMTRMSDPNVTLLHSGDAFIGDLTLVRQSSN
jgi:2',3'-cyclic-nucleotide 2'-phosphodiesterase (5'-nucleotidase family)